MRQRKADIGLSLLLYLTLLIKNLNQFFNYLENNDIFACSLYLMCFKPFC